MHVFEYSSLLRNLSLISGTLKFFVTNSTFLEKTMTNFYEHLDSKADETICQAENDLAVSNKSLAVFPQNQGL